MSTTGPSDSRGVGPSAVSRWMRDRSLRLAAGLAVAVAIPVAVLFYFQFRSIAALSQSSAVVLRQLSQETADGSDAGRCRMRCKRALYQRPASRDAGADRTARSAGNLADVRAGARDRAVRDAVLRLVGADPGAPRRGARLRPRAPRLHHRGPRRPADGQAVARARAAEARDLGLRGDGRRPPARISRRSCDSSRPSRDS